MDEYEERRGLRILLLIGGDWQAVEERQNLKSTGSGLGWTQQALGRLLGRVQA